MVNSPLLKPAQLSKTLLQVDEHNIPEEVVNSFTGVVRKACAAWWSGDDSGLRCRRQVCNSRPYYHIAVTDGKDWYQRRRQGMEVRNA